jgi:hypothetical protein
MDIVRLRCWPEHVVFADVDRHKKGLTNAQKKQWVAAANTSLQDCLSDGGSQETCEGRAIRIANAAVEKGEEKAAAGAVSTTNLPHGTGSMLGAAGAALGDGDKCACPECDYETEKGDTPCGEVKCPECGAALRREGVKMDETAKAEWTRAYINDLPDASFLHVESGGEKDDEGKTAPRSLRHLPYKDAAGKVDLPHLRNALSRLGQPATGKGEESWLTEDLRKRLQAKAQRILEGEGGEAKSRFISYKSGDTWRWLSISSLAVEDKEEEIVSEKAYDDAIAYANHTRRFGELDLVHVKGTDVGDCDLMARLDKQLVESGTWRSEPMATKARQSVQSDADYWGVSIKFRYDPKRFDGKTYRGGIHILKRTILPREMAASYGTAIAVTGGKAMKMIDEETKAALAKLGLEDEQIAELAEKAKAVQDEPNVKLKEDEGLREKVVHWVAEALGVRREDAMPEASREMTEVPAPSTTEAAPVEAKATQPQPQRELILDDEALTAIGQKAAESLAAKMAEALGPMIQPLQEELESVKARLVEAEKSVEEKVQVRLDELPPIVKVAPTVVAGETVAKMPEGAQPEQPATEAQKFLSDVADLVKKGLGTNDLTRKVSL